MMMKVIFAFLMVCVGFVAAPEVQTEDYPLCGQCERRRGDMEYGLKAALANGILALRPMCQLSSKTERTCYSFLKLIERNMKGLSEKLFGDASENFTTLSCSHIMPLCADETESGERVDPSRWSCKSCKTLFESIFQTFRTTMEEVNSELARAMCLENDESCIQIVRKALGLSVSIAGLLEEQAILTNICQNALKCVQ